MQIRFTYQRKWNSLTWQPIVPFYVVPLPQPFLSLIFPLPIFLAEILKIVEIFFMIFITNLDAFAALGLALLSNDNLCCTIFFAFFNSFCFEDIETTRSLVTFWHGHRLTLGDLALAFEWAKMTWTGQYLSFQIVEFFFFLFSLFKMIIYQLL